MKNTPGWKLADDLWGGLAAALVALPSSIAYGVAAYGMLGAEYVRFGVMAGILGAIALGLVASAIGGTPRLVSAPCAPAAAVLAALAIRLMNGPQADGARPAPATILVLLTIVALISSGLQFLYGRLGGGRLIKFIPYPVVSGYLSGVGVLIFLSQVPKFFGLPKHLDLWTGLTAPDHWKWQGLVVGATTIAGVLAAPRLTKAVPASIIGLLGGVAAYFSLGLAFPELLKLSHNELVIGPIDASIHSIVTDCAGRWQAMGALHFQDLKALLFPAFTLSILLSIDTLKTCVIVDTLTRSRHNSNRELMGQGLGNFASGLIGGMPGAGTMGATLVNVSSGGRTRLSGVFGGAFALAAFVLFGGWIAWIPLAALAGILMVVAFRMVDWSSLHLLRSRATLLDFFVIAAVIIVAVRVNLIAASGTGLGLALLLFVREQIRGSVIHRKVYGNHVSSKRIRLPSEIEVLEKNGHLTVVCELRSSLFFGTTDRLFTEIEPDLRRCRFLILDMKRVQSVDFTAAHILEQFQSMLKERGAFMIFSSLPSSLPTGQNLQAYFDEVGVMKPTENVKLFATLAEAIEWAEDRILEQPGLFQHKTAEKPLELHEFELLGDMEKDPMFAALKNSVVERFVPAGETIFRHDDKSDELYFIRQGAVRIQLPIDGGKHHTLAYFGPGNFFGELSFLDTGLRSADAIVTADTALYVLSRKRFEDVVRLHPLIGGKVFSRMARVLAYRLRYTDGEVRALQEA